MKIMKNINSAIMMLAFSSTLLAGNTKELKLASPNGTQEIAFYQKQVSPSVNELYYRVDYKGNSVINESRAGLELDNRIWEMALGARDLKQPACWMDNLEVDSVAYQPETNITWHPLYGERSTVHDHYKAATLYLSKKDNSGYRLNIEVRAYDEGVAFRYFFPEHPKAIFHKVVGDLTEYTLPEGTKAWTEQWAQAFFEYLDINDIKHPVERALTLELPNGTWAALADADVDDWCLTKYLASTDKKNTLTSVMYSPVDVVTYYATPWKIIMAADKPGELLEHNDIIQNLNPPCEIPDAASHDGDATKVVAKLDMPRVIAYGKEKGVGIWVYVNQHALMKQMRELFPLLRQWGIVGVKSGFVQYASHRWATWMHDMVRLAAENHLLMNIHDEYRPSGFSRTYPNLLTQEGICGNEEFPDATHNVTLPFTRMINGAADYTICYYDKRLKTTHAHQLAASLVFYSPLQTIFWYDKPSFYNGEPEIEWFENLQTVFDDTKVLDGAPGKNITMARRKGQEWFVATLTNNDGSAENVPLSFLDKDKTYLACIYTDGGEKVKTKTQVKCTYLLVKSTQTMKFQLKPSGGAAIRLIPVDGKEMKKYKAYKGQKL